jgi:hypothetical protein
MIPSRPPLSGPPDEITQYFTKLGYQVSWDFSTQDSTRWYEILDSNRLLLQIDKGVSLSALREDMICWNKGEEGTSNESFEVHSTLWDTPEIKNLLEKVAETKP